MDSKDITNCIETIANFPTIYATGNITPLEIMRQSGYSKLFSDVTIENISEHLLQKPKLIADWIQYSEDIRHFPCWAFWKNANGTWKVSRLQDKNLVDEQDYDDRFFACAKMIKMSLEDIRKNNP
jgi:hypothetical protein